MIRRLMFSAVLLAACVAGAGAVDLTAPITQLDGKPLVDQTGAPSPRTLGQIVEDTLLITEPSTTPAEKNRRFWLALKVHESIGKDVTFSAEELVEIKAVLAKFQTTLVAGQAVRLLDPGSKPKD